MKRFLINILVNFIVLACFHQEIHAQFTSTPIDSGEFYIRSFSILPQGEETTLCDKLPIKYFLTDTEVGFDCMGEAILYLKWKDYGDGHKSWAVDQNNNRWLVHFEYDGEKTNQIYKQVTPDGSKYLDSPHFQISSEDVCP